MSEEIDDECDDTEDIMSATQEMIDNITYRNCELHDENDKLKSECERLRGELDGVRAHMNACRSLTHCPSDEVLYEHLKAFFTGGLVFQQPQATVGPQEGGA